MYITLIHRRSSTDLNDLYSSSIRRYIQEQMNPDFMASIKAPKLNSGLYSNMERLRWEGKKSANSPFNLCNTFVEGVKGVLKGISNSSNRAYIVERVFEVIVGCNQAKRRGSRLLNNKNPLRFRKRSGSFIVKFHIFVSCARWLYIQLLPQILLH